MIGQAGREKGDDVLVNVNLNTSDGVNVDVESKVKQLFGKQIEKSVKEVLDEMNIKNVLVTLKDQGALDFVIRARVKTAIRRAKGGVN
ncbi:citrate lyase acyl carrier protein [Clostridium sp.]|uniref:citrate lyase acyl carrier protein n=1 Tax=Clostridium sp. TaxID=1506 RepID=UPI001A62CD9F|nr:citrate lyase acyl carrier protein [Clostridium sp.]MBK5241329.1 citrate lyase acyl carrier protein [Clostridium sp.]